MNQADTYTASDSSFNEIFESDQESSSEEIEDGLENMLEEFTYKMQFLKGVKDSNKVSVKQRTDTGLTH